jgi:hypothetical protein
MDYWDFLMGYKRIQNLLWMVPLVLLSVGFRVFPDNTGWAIDPSSTATRKVFITLTASGKTMQNNLPSSDVLHGAGSTLTEAQLLNSIINDFNGVQRSNLILALDSDSDFAAQSTNKRIYIREGGAAGLSSGQAVLTTQNTKITSCQIDITPTGYESAKNYLSLVTHELGHCMGLDHPQETVWSVMSYFNRDEIFRLSIDDKMGLVYLYAKDPSYRSERATLGLSCARRN